MVTANPAAFKTRFPIYQKGIYQTDILKDLFGSGIFSTDGENWKFQRQVASHEFNTTSLRKFIETVVDAELSDKLIPILSDAANNQTVLNLQDILQRFAFDNICNISFGYDPEYLTPSLSESKFATAFDDAQKKQEMMLNSKEISSSETEDLLTRFLKSGHSDEKFVSDIVISFLLAGRDSTSAASTWFFWLLHKNKQVETEIVREINKNKGKQVKTTEHSSVYEDVKDMVYIHAALCESMRLYPPVTKEATKDDVLPDGTLVKKGMMVTYYPYAMGRMKTLWGPDWAEFRPG
ncbi:Cytochrome P450 94A1 [Bienertia sinuspersici]